jgi:hypothetical protein
MNACLRRLAPLAALLAAAAAAQAQEAAVTRRATQLRDAPGDNAKLVLALPAQSALTRLPERQGPWVQVRTAQGQTGWLHLFDVGPAGAPAEGGSSASGALRGITGFFTKGSSPAPTTVATSTIGIRGLSAEDLSRAQPNLAAVQQAESLRQNERDARAFANAAALTPVNVEPLPAPPRPASGGNNNSNGNTPNAGGE